MMYEEWATPEAKHMFLMWIVVWSIIWVIALYNCTSRVERGDGLSQTTQYQSYQVQETNDEVSPAVKLHLLNKAWGAASSSSHSSSSHSSRGHSSRGHHHH